MSVVETGFFEVFWINNFASKKLSQSKEPAYYNNTAHVAVTESFDHTLEFVEALKYSFFRDKERYCEQIASLMDIKRYAFSYN